MPRESERTSLGSESDTGYLGCRSAALCGSGLTDPSRVDDLTASSPRVNAAASLGGDARLAEWIGTGGSLADEGVGFLKSGRLVAGCRFCPFVGTAFRANGFESLLDGCLGGSGRSLEVLGETSLDGSGEEAGEIGETKVSRTGVLMSSLWYSGVGGR